MKLVMLIAFLLLAQSCSIKNIRESRLEKFKKEYLSKIESNSKTQDISKNQSYSEVPNVFETGKKFSGEVKGVFFSMSPNYQKREQGVNELNFVAIQSGSIISSLNNRPRKVSAIIAEYRGQCSQVITLNIRIPYPKAIGVSGHTEKSILEFPINEILNTAVKFIPKQCPGIEVIRVKYQPTSREALISTGGAGFPNPYFGSMSKENSWSLKEGIEEKFSSKTRVKIKFRDFFGFGGIDYEGNCENEPYLVLDPQHYKSDYLKKIPDMNAYSTVAQSAAVIYGQECPKTKIIRFILNPMPDVMKCRDREECFIVSEKRGLTSEEEKILNQTGSAFIEQMKASGWVTSTSEFERRPLSPIGNLNYSGDIIEVLAAGEFAILKDFPRQFSNFYTLFIETYSDMCKKYINDPVVREIQWVSKSYDNNGFLTSIDEKNKQRIYIEKKYDAIFSRFYSNWFAVDVFKLIEGMASGKNVAGSILTNIKVIRSLVRDCQNDRLNIVYKNMYNYASGLPAIKGKYKTAKKPAEFIYNHKVSAPKKLFEITKD